MAVYPFQKLVRAARLHSELEAALGVGVVTAVNTSEGPPPNGQIITSRDLTGPEYTTGLGVVQNHDGGEPEGLAAVYKQLRAAAAPLIGVQFTSLTLAQLRVVLAAVVVRLGFIDASGALKLPDAE